MKRRIHGSDAGQLLEVIRDLYQLNSDNRDDTKHRYIPRLENLRDRGSRLGWGYGDFLNDALEDALEELIPEELPD